jgi:hypothetical protein
MNQVQLLMRDICWSYTMARLVKKNRQYSLETDPDGYFVKMKSEMMVVLNAKQSAQKKTGC